MPKEASKPDPKKQLMIKVNACKRLVKEAAYYEKEASENELQLKEMKDTNKDPYDIKKFQEVLGESQMMIPVSVASRDKALDELKEFVALLNEEEGDNVDLMECEWMGEARKLLGLGERSVGESEVLEFAVTNVSGLEDGEAF
ncbi:hypothetical protein ACHAWU_009463 [Discostella pseudostelligera]|uniref:Tubulin-specific chaperone A n=1 Tax=Discostella pseudostelligera TaxID=259834 RepID=A0ABD3MB79_9STRA